ncbi:alpha/beta-type small acid-soluble spore protein [Thermoactinomyces mirandus]|uniref:alpha/beta-type small acid-soluble spore protein n=1 Tax=Thermoactinomyces mirandus TaxID=2756294 RepID=UPI001C6893C4|nr:alpha/beta-type small acid-soluble spore protein [Thermoactinomyces mirandus]
MSRSQEKRNELNQLKKLIISEVTGRHIQYPEDVSMEVAKQLNIPLKKTGNGDIRATDAGKIGGFIGGHMVKELVRMAQDELARER